MLIRSKEASPRKRLPDQLVHFEFSLSLLVNYYEPQIKITITNQFFSAIFINIKLKNKMDIRASTPEMLSLQTQLRFFFDLAQ